MATSPGASSTSDAERPRSAPALTPVFFVAAVGALGFVAAAGASPGGVQQLFEAALAWIATRFGWFYTLSVAFFLGFVIWLALSRHGDVRLGPDDARPEFGTLSWFAMLFSAGMGIGIVFFGVAEPILHFEAPPIGDPRSHDAAQRAMNIALFHWGPHAWAIYATLGLALAYFGHRKGMPFSVRSALHPLLGERIHGAPGHVVDLLAVFGTLFGLATSLGLGATQIGAGFQEVFGVKQSPAGQIAIIAAVTLAATLSLVSGLRHGIRRLSELNLLLSATLLAFVFLAGPTLFLLDSFADNIGSYLRSFIPRTFGTYPLTDGTWHRRWTLFYWGWWISWAPFVGTFIARISRGRTVREFVLYVLLVPTVVTFVWFTVFGSSALHIELFGGGGIAAAVQEDTATSVYALLRHLPVASVTSVLTVVVVISFFVTSSDSGSFVVDMLTSGGHPNPPVWQRVFWALMEGAIAAALLLAGGLEGLRAAAIVTGLPFCVILLLVCFGLVRALGTEPSAGRP
jgi:choline/glycine/proline betaine transport protein